MPRVVTCPSRAQPCGSVTSSSPPLRLGTASQAEGRGFDPRRPLWLRVAGPDARRRATQPAAARAAGLFGDRDLFRLRGRRVRARVADSDGDRLGAGLVADPPGVDELVVRRVVL